MGNPLPIIQALASAFYQPQLQAAGVDKNGNYVDASGKPTSLYSQPGWFQRGFNPEARLVNTMNLEASSAGLESEHNRELQRHLAGEDVTTLPPTSQVYPGNTEAEITEYLNGIKTPSQAFGELNSIDKINAGIPELATQEDLSQIAADKAANKQRENYANTVSPLGIQHDVNTLHGQIAADPYTANATVDEAKLKSGLDDTSLNVLGEQQDTLKKNLTKEDLAASQVAPTPYIMDTVDDSGHVSSPAPVATGAPSMALRAMNMGIDPVTHKILPWVPDDDAAFTAGGMGYSTTNKPSDMYGVSGIRKRQPTTSSQPSAPITRTQGIIPSLVSKYSQSLTGLGDEPVNIGPSVSRGISNAYSDMFGGPVQSSPSQPTTIVDVALRKKQLGIPLTPEEQAAIAP